MSDEILDDFEEVLVEYPETRFILDIRKNDTNHIKQVIKVVEAANAIGRVIVVSEFDEVINRCRDLPVDWTYGAPTSEARAVIFDSQMPVSPVFMIPEVHDGIRLLSAELLTKLHKQGTRIWIWTIDQPDTFLRLKEEGADGIFTNVPEDMLNQLKQAS